MNVPGPVLGMVTGEPLGDGDRDPLGDELGEEEGLREASEPEPAPELDPEPASVPAPALEPVLGSGERRERSGEGEGEADASAPARPANFSLPPGVQPAAANPTTPSTVATPSPVNSGPRPRRADLFLRRPEPFPLLPAVPVAESCAVARSEPLPRRRVRLRV